MSQPERLTDEHALDARLAAGAFLVFKHSPICPVSARAWGEYERFLGRTPDAASGWIQVIAERPLSRGVASRFGVAHESPQALLISDGTCVWHASHGGITADALARAWSEHASAAH